MHDFMNRLCRTKEETKEIDHNNIYDKRGLYRVILIEAEERLREVKSKKGRLREEPLREAEDSYEQNQKIENINILSIKVIIEQLNNYAYKDHILSNSITQNKNYLLDKTYIQLWEQLLTISNLDATINEYMIPVELLDRLNLNIYKEHYNEHENYIINGNHDNNYKNVDNIQEIINNSTYYNIADLYKKILISTKQIIFNDPIISTFEEKNISEDSLDIFITNYNNLLLECNNELFNILTTFPPIKTLNELNE
jgi:hypothetical protein